MKRDEWSEYIWEENSSTQNGDAPLAEKGEVVNIRQITVEHKNKMCVSVCGVRVWSLLLDTLLRRAAARV
jgi:hypothetical protein